MNTNACPPRSPVREYAFVFVGGAAGSVLRGLAVPALPSVAWLSSTFVVNVVACLVLGWLHAVRHRLHAHLLLLGAVGFCGGLSTFSTFAAEVFAAIVAADPVRALGSPALEITVGVAAALAGELLGRRLHGGRRA